MISTTLLISQVIVSFEADCLVDFDTACLKPEKFVSYLLEYLSPSTEVRSLDIWDMEIQVADDGLIQKVAEVVSKDEKGIP